MKVINVKCYHSMPEDEITLVVPASMEDDEVADLFKVLWIAERNKAALEEEEDE